MPGRPSRHRLRRLPHGAPRGRRWPRRQLEFDLVDIYRAARASGAGYARFTPPAQIIAALRKALEVFEAEGGQAARLARYTANMRALVEGVRGLGLDLYLPAAVQGPIVVNFAAPADSAGTCGTSSKR